jgi:hypothetical protein
MVQSKKVSSKKKEKNYTETTKHWYGHNGYFLSFKEI